MLLTATVTRDELVHLVESLTPARITLDARRGRSVTLGRPHLIELVPGIGLRLRGDARITWDVAGLAVPITIQVWQLVLVPRIATNTRKLTLEPIMEELDLKRVPAFLDGKIASAIRDGIAQQKDRIAWDFARTLSKRIPLPARMAPSRLFEIVAAEGAVTVTESEIRLTMRFASRVTEQRQPAQSQTQLQTVPPPPPSQSRPEKQPPEAQAPRSVPLASVR